jgi:hypothetical protein
MWIDNVHSKNQTYTRLQTHSISILYVHRHVTIKCSFLKFGEKGIQVYILIEHNTNHTDD